MHDMCWYCKKSLMCRKYWCISKFLRSADWKKLAQIFANYKALMWTNFFKSQIFTNLTLADFNKNTLGYLRISSWANFKEIVTYFGNFNWGNFCICRLLQISTTVTLAVFKNSHRHLKVLCGPIFRNQFQIFIFS